MRAAVFAFSRQGLRTARRVRAALAEAGDGCRLFAPERLAEEGLEAIAPPLADFTAPLFREMDALIFISSCGIAVRAIAPHVRDKRTDPAVVAADERARFVIPLLSGHIGGANALAGRLAEALGAAAAVTTATDVNGRFSVDAWAAEQGLAIGDMQAAKAVSAAILEGPVPLISDFPVAGGLPPGLTYGETGPVGVRLSCRRGSPFARTLTLTPRVVRLGIGCRRGAEAGAIGRLADQVLQEHDILPAAVKYPRNWQQLRHPPLYGDLFNHMLHRREKILSLPAFLHDSVHIIGRGADNLRYTPVHLAGSAVHRPKPHQVLKEKPARLKLHLVPVQVQHLGP